MIEKLLEAGNLKTGQGSIIANLKIVADDTEAGRANIIIGNDCYLMGSVFLYNKHATVTIGDRVFIGPDTVLFCYDSITIEDDVMFSWGCTVIDTNAHSLKSAERASDVLDWKKGWQYKNWDVVQSLPVTIKTKAWIGFNSIITKGVTIEEGTVVASGSVVTKNTAPYTIVGGNPAVFIKNTE